MICIVGLGNPGEKYQNNRHNVGFLFIDYLLKELQITDYEWKFDKYLNSQYVNTLINNEKLLLLKPLTFMNKSGEAVSKLMRNLKLEIGNLVIVHDDLDIPLGKFKIQQGTGPQLHNGLESIEQHLKTKDFCRVRIGVDNRSSPEFTLKEIHSEERVERVEGETYVLQNFDPSELLIIHSLFSGIVKKLQTQRLI